MLANPFVDAATRRVKLSSTPSGIPTDGLQAAFIQGQKVEVIDSAAASWGSSWVAYGDRGVVFDGATYLTRAAPNSTLADSKQATIVGTFSLASLTGSQLIAGQRLAAGGSSDLAFALYWFTDRLSIYAGNGVSTIVYDAAYIPSGAIVAGVTYSYWWTVDLASGTEVLWIDGSAVTLTTTTLVNNTFGFSSATTAPYVVGTQSDALRPLTGNIGRVVLMNQYLDPATNWSLFFGPEGQLLDPTVEGPPGTYTFESANVSQQIPPSYLLTNVTWSAQQGVGPTGEPAYKMESDGTPAVPYYTIGPNDEAFTAGVTYTLSVLMKATPDWSYAYLGTNNSNAIISIDLTDGSNLPGSGAVTAVDEGDGWWRVTFETVALGGNRPYYGLVASDGSTITTIPSGSGVLFSDFKSYLTVAPALNLQLESDDPASFALNTRASGGALVENGTGLTLYEGYTITQATASQRFVAEINLADPDIETAWSSKLSVTALGGQSDPLGGTDAVLLTSTSAGATYAVDDLPALRTGDWIKIGYWLKRVGAGNATIDMCTGNGNATQSLTVTSSWAFVETTAVQVTNGAATNNIGMLDGTNPSGEAIAVFLPQASITTGQLDTDVMPPFTPFGAPPVALRSDGIDDYMQVLIASLVQPTTIIVRAEEVTWTQADYIFDGVGLVNGGGLQQIDPTPNVRIIADSAKFVLSNRWAVGSTAVVISVFDGANGLLQVDNQAPSTGDAGAGDMLGLTLAARTLTSNFANTRYFDVLVYNRALSAEEIDAVVPGISNYRAMRGMALGAGGSLLYTLEGVADSYVNGVPQSNRALLVDTTAAAVDHFVPPGFPITADGKLAVDLSAPVNHISNGIPYTADSKIAATITDLRAAILPVISP